MEGDRAHNVKTVAVRFGARKAAVVASVFSVAAVCLSPLPLFLGIVSIWFVQPVLITDAGLLVSAVLLLKNPSRENAKKTKQRNLIWFVTGLLAFIMGTL
jgi:geranylgeranylglycerol-phosphate geranylgeranyltransferase